MSADTRKEPFIIAVGEKGSQGKWKSGVRNQESEEQLAAMESIHSRNFRNASPR